MGDLKPIGSEKLTGESKLKRIMEIANYGRAEAKPTNPLLTEHYRITMADGLDYRIIFEKNKYVIQRGLNENFDYLDRIENRKYFNSYSSALTKLNLIAKETNALFGAKTNLDLFEQKRYTLKGSQPQPAQPQQEPLNGPEMDLGGALDPVQPAMDPTLTQAPTDTQPPVPAGIDNPNAIDGGPMDDPNSPDMMDDSVKGEVSFKQIQKLTGRLGQKLREYSSSAEFTSKDMKYVINSILSALDLTKLSDEDAEQILNRFDIEGDVDNIDPIEDEVPELPEQPQPAPALGEGDFDEDDFKVTDELMDSIFAESRNKRKKNLLSEGIKKINETIKSIKVVKQLSESVNQAKVGLKIMRQYPSGTFKGKTNKNNLIFEYRNKLFKVDPKGEITIWN